MKTCPVCNQLIDNVSPQYEIKEADIHIHKPCGEWLIVGLPPRHECEICWKTSRVLTGGIQGSKHVFVCDNCIEENHQRHSQPEEQEQS